MVNKKNKDEVYSKYNFNQKLFIEHLEDFEKSNKKFKFTSDHKLKKNIIQALVVRKSLCPCECVPNIEEHSCPCENFLSTGSCKCNLFIKK